MNEFFKKKNNSSSGVQLLGVDRLDIG